MFSRRKLIWRSLRFYLRSHLGALLGAIIGSAVLVGALAVGDSVRTSLHEMALARLGRIDIALDSNDRLFRTGLAEKISADVKSDVAPVLRLPGAAVHAETAARANNVQVIGIDSRFGRLSSTVLPFEEIRPDTVVLNQRLALQLKVHPGDNILIRVKKPSELSRDAPLSPEEKSSVALRLEVAAVLSDDTIGRFSLQANQIPPFNAFVSLAALQKNVKAADRANLLLAASAGSERGGELTAAQASLRRHWRLPDADLELVPLRDGRGVELRSGRIFLEPPVVHAAVQAATNAQPVLTYLVNELRAGEKTTPYAMVTATGPPLLPADLKEDEAIINQWLADDLEAKPGQELRLKYYVVGNMRKLEERVAVFRIRSVVPMTGPTADPTLMPDFPGLTDAKNCRDWDTGLPINTDAIREKDEKYWDTYRGTPKAFVSLAAGQKMWANRFGNVTSIRYHLDPSAPAVQTNEISGRIERSLLDHLDPAALGLQFQPVRSQALAAGAQGQDFGGLFLGFSFFLIVAALILMALLFVFGIEQRAEQVGVLLALGFTPKQVRRLLWMEGGMVALIGGVLGAIGGIFYAKGMLWALATIWRSAIGTTSLRYHASAATIAGGAAAGFLAAWLAIGFALRKQARQPARVLLTEGAIDVPETGRKRGRFALWTAAVSGVAAFALLGFALAEKETADTFFSAGMLLLIAGLAFCSVFLQRLERKKSHALPNVRALAIRGLARRRRRTLATIGLLACGSFLIASIGVFRLETSGSAERSSGTGGFAFVGQTTLPIVYDLNSAEGREHFGLDEKEMADVAAVPFRVHEGEDASCLNLNRAQRPQLLGVNPRLLSDRGAFSFAGVVKGASAKNPWLLLDERAQDGAIPAIGDAASIQWALGKKLGDTLDYVDDRGNKFKVRLVAAVANSILQGNLIIAEDAFVRLFPGEAGYRFFLLDVPPGRLAAVGASLSRALEDQGMELQPAERRLAEFNAVQNTYLNTFQVLGGLGLLLGSAGLGVVVLRNVLERRGELALLIAVGFRRGALKRMVMSEHGALLIFGLLVGIVSALAAVLPQLLAPGAKIPYVTLGGTLIGVLISGAVWTWVATVVALRGPLLPALRNE